MKTATKSRVRGRVQTRACVCLWSDCLSRLIAVVVGLGCGCGFSEVWTNTRDEGRRTGATHAPVSRTCLKKNA